MNTHQQPSSKSWEEEFDKEFSQKQFFAEIGFHKCEGWNDDDTFEMDTGFVTVDLTEVKSFIQSLLTSHSQAIRERVSGLKGEGGLRLDTFKEGHKDGYNKAVDDILALLTDDKTTNTPGATPDHKIRG